MPTELERRPPASFRRFEDWFDLPDVWAPADRAARPGTIRVEETVADGMLTIRAEMPGIDPDEDVEITVADGTLTIAAERRVEHARGRAGAPFGAVRYGWFSRTLRLPAAVEADDVTATYRDGILTVEVPMPAPPADAATGVTRVHVARA